jgi:hypothetical protein
MMIATPKPLRRQSSPHARYHIKKRIFDAFFASIKLWHRLCFTVSRNRRGDGYG